MYTASVRINQIKPTGGTEETARIDYVFGKGDLGKFTDNVKTYGAAANLMFGAGSHLADWQIKQLNGESWLGAMLKDQWTNPVNLLAGASMLAASMPNLNFAAAPARNMMNPARSIAMGEIEKAIATPGFADPGGAAGATAHYTTILQNGNTYNLKVIYNSETNTILHFHYSRKAMGPLEAIKK